MDSTDRLANRLFNWRTYAYYAFVSIMWALAKLFALAAFIGELFFETIMNLCVGPSDILRKISESNAIRSKFPRFYRAMLHVESSSFSTFAGAFLFSSFLFIVGMIAYKAPASDMWTSMLILFFCVLSFMFAEGPENNGNDKGTVHAYFSFLGFFFSAGVIALSQIIRWLVS